MSSSIHVEGLRDVFRCFICMEQLRDARLCPHCSKFCCYRCIRRWITEQRQQCPHCRASLRLTELVKCRWANEVTQRLDTLKTEPNSRQDRDEFEKCDVHDEKLTVFCWTCQECICHHCALWGGQHTGHTLKPLEDEYKRQVAQINEEVRCLRRRLCLLIGSLHGLEKNMESIRGEKEDRVREIRGAVDLMIAKLDSQLKGKLLSLTSQKRSLSMEVDMVEGMLAEVEHQLASSSHSLMIANSTELFMMLKKIPNSPPIVPHVPIRCDFQSEIVPPYDDQLFVLRPFSELRTLASPVCSPPLTVNGMSWRLKVYPNGNGVVRGNYLSVFLELSHGSTDQARYEYRVEMLHQHCENDQPARNIVREFASDFELGECWGYNRFFKLDQLECEGYLSPEDDTLRLRFYVRASTFFQKCKDLQWYIDQLDAERKHTRKNVDQLQSRLVACMSTQVEPLDQSDLVESGPIESLEEHEYRQLDDIPQMACSLVAEAVQQSMELPPSALERDVEDEARSMDNDVDDLTLTAHLNRISLEVSDRHSPPDHHSPSNQTPFQVDDVERTVSRIQEAFRASLVDSMDDWPMSTHDHPTASCTGRGPSCSPRSRKQLFRRLRSRHRGEFVGVRGVVRGPMDNEPSDIDIEQLEREIRMETANSSGRRAGELENDA